MREAPARDRVGRVDDRRQDQRDPAATDIVPAVPPVPALLPPVARPVQGQVAVVDGERGQAVLAASEGAADELAVFREALNDRECGMFQEQRPSRDVTKKKACLLSNECVGRESTLCSRARKSAFNKTAHSSKSKAKVNTVIQN